MPCSTAAALSQQLADRGTSISKVLKIGGIINSGQSNPTSENECVKRNLNPHRDRSVNIASVPLLFSITTRTAEVSSRLLALIAYREK